jgi:hypothetical protein
MATDAGPTSLPGDQARRISLKILLGAAAVDAVFLVALLVVLVVGGTGAARVPAALYAFGFLYLLYLAAKGAMEGRWGWWYVALVAVTLGPLGAVVGARRIQAQMPAPAPPPPTDRPTRKAQRKAAAERRREDR